MRFLLPSIIMSIVAATVGCTTCGNSSCCSLPADFCSMGCCRSNGCVMESCTDCVSCGPASCSLSCDTCTPSCGTPGYQVIYDGPAIHSPVAGQATDGYSGYHHSPTAVPSGIPTNAAPSNARQQPSVTIPKPPVPPQHDSPSVVTNDARPVAPSPKSIVRPPAPAAPSPEPQKIKTTKPVKNFLPSILSDDT